MPAELHTAFTLPLTLQTFEERVFSGTVAHAGECGWFMLDKYAVTPGVAGWTEEEPGAEAAAGGESEADGRAGAVVRRTRVVEFDTSGVPGFLSSYVDRVTVMMELREAHSPSPGVLHAVSTLVVPVGTRLHGSVDASITTVATQVGDAELAIDITVVANINASYFLRVSVEQLISSYGGQGLERWAARAVRNLPDYLAASYDAAPDAHAAAAASRSPSPAPASDTDTDEFFDTSADFVLDDLDDDDLFAVFAARLDAVLSGVDAINARLDALEATVTASRPPPPPPPPSSLPWLSIFVTSASLALLAVFAFRRSK